MTPERPDSVAMPCGALHVDALHVDARRYRIEATVDRPIELPDYGGSALRGVFGHALRDIACTTGRRDCAGCPRQRDCAYLALFQPPPPVNARRVYSAIAAPYIIEPTTRAAGSSRLERGDTLSFTMVLVGRAEQHERLVALAWKRALRRGLGALQGTAVLERFDAVDNAPPSMSWPHPSGQATSISQSMTLRFETPLRIKHQGRILGPAALRPSHLLFALVSRIADLQEFHSRNGNGHGHGHERPAHPFAAYREAAERIDGQVRMRRQHWSRHSSRQARSMDLDGLIGTVHLEGDLAPFQHAIRLGLWVHVGGKTTFGLGRYRIESEIESVT